ncbi:MAG: hypothetical protein ACLTSX_02340 [Collinsella sp.]
MRRHGTDHGAGGCEKGYYLADCFGLRLLNRRGCFPKWDLFLEQTKDIWKDMLDIRKRFEPRAEELAKKYALAPYTMMIGSGALWGETILYSCASSRRCSGSAPATSRPMTSSMALSSSWSPASTCSCSRVRMSAVSSTTVSRLSCSA